MRYFVNEGGDASSPLVSQVEESQQHWALTDADGNVIGLTDKDGNLTDTFQYDAFGDDVGRTGETETPLQYRGQQGMYREIGAMLSNGPTWYEPSLGCSAAGRGRSLSVPVFPGPVIITEPPESVVVPGLPESEKRRRIGDAIDCMAECGYWFEHYAALNFPIIVVRHLPGSAGWTNPLTGTVYVEEWVLNDPATLFAVLSHEMQHIHDIFVCLRPFSTHKEPWRTDEEMLDCYWQKCAPTKAAK